MWPARSLALIWLWVCVAYCGLNTDQNHFILPPLSGNALDYSNNLVLSLGSTQVIQWETNQTDYYIALFQQTPQSGGVQNQTIFESGLHSSTSSFSWFVQTYGTNLSLSNIYFLWLNPGADEGFTCHYFNITDNSPVSTISSITSTSTSTISSTSSIITSTSSGTVTSTTSGSLNPTAAAAINSTTGTTSSNNHTATDVGLGVGIGVGGTLVLLVAAFFALRWYKRRPAAQAATGAGAGAPAPSEPYTDHKDYYAPQQQQQPWQPAPTIFEAPAEGSGNEVYEAPTYRPIFEAPTKTRTAEME